MAKEFELNLPVGCQVVPLDEPATISEGKVREDGMYDCGKPVFEGIMVQVQHPDGVAPVTAEAGMIGIGIAMIEGHPVVILNLKHADGTSLSAIMSDDDFASGLGLLYVNAIGKLKLLDAEEGTKQ